jgi:hypothetical protein
LDVVVPIEPAFHRMDAHAVERSVGYTALGVKEHRDGREERKDDGEQRAHNHSPDRQDGDDEPADRAGVPYETTTIRLCGDAGRILAAKPKR